MPENYHEHFDVIVHFERIPAVQDFTGYRNEWTSQYRSALNVLRYQKKHVSKKNRIIQAMSLATRKPCSQFRCYVMPSTYQLFSAGKTKIAYGTVSKTGFSAPRWTDHGKLYYKPTFDLPQFYVSKKSSSIMVVPGHCIRKVLIAEFKLLCDNHQIGPHTFLANSKDPLLPTHPRHVTWTRVKPKKNEFDPSHELAKYLAKRNIPLFDRNMDRGVDALREALETIRLDIGEDLLKRLTEIVHTADAFKEGINWYRDNQPVEADLYSNMFLGEQDD